MSLKIKARMLDVPVFHQPERTGNEYRTLEKTLLKGSTWSGYLKHLHLMTGLKYSLTQYVWRRSLINAINNKAPFFVRDQVVDHEFNTVQYYLDTIIRFDLEAAVIKLLFNKMVQKAAHGLFLNTNITVFMKLINELKRKITENSKIRELIKCSKELI
ncbi:hypothetical protein AJ78_08716 [Emergomyces pasteurianus Ep9510]|uniref:Uncharacterized protein n=1 Tax=Emergomyces pasteurianus Ep9510 TaxID=1447872 RepID=A0A1J9PQN3_9EURO|nr:hypothetical protein AJ78_08716 [Emergomyces pasteurianus Ep9510]